MLCYQVFYAKILHTAAFMLNIVIWSLKNMFEKFIWTR